MTTTARASARVWPADRLERLPRCPVCSDARRKEELSGLVDMTFGVAPGEWNLQRCLNCGCAYLDPRPDPQSIALAYQSYYTHALPPTVPDTGIAATIRKSIGNSFRNRLFGTRLAPALPGGWLLASLFPTTAGIIRSGGRGLERLSASARRVLDVGCGNGQFLDFAKRMDWQCYGVEPDAAAAAVCRARGIEIVGAQLSDLDRSYEGFFDAVTLSHVIEHLHYPVEALTQCWHLLKPGGYLWLETPNIDSVGYQVYGSSWRGLEPPRHLVLLNPASLRTCIGAAGFERIRLLSSPGVVTSHTFMLSALIQAGHIAEGGAQQLSPDDQVHLAENIRKALAVVRKDPSRAEFIGAAAYRPSSPDSERDRHRQAGLALR